MTLQRTASQIGYVSVATERGRIIEPVHIYVAQFITMILFYSTLQIAIIFSARALFAVADNVIIDIMTLWLYRFVVIGAIAIPVLIFALRRR